MAKATFENTTPSRRAILAGAAALPALAVPMIAVAGTDEMPASLSAKLDRHRLREGVGYERPDR